MAYQQKHTQAKSTGFSAQARALSRRDILIYVTEYDLERGLIIGKGVTDGRHIEASVDPQKVAKGRENEQRNPAKTQAASYLGHSIDAKMKSVIDPTSGIHIAVLEGAEVTRKITKTIDGSTQETRLVRCSRISDGGVDPEKTFEALISLSFNARYNSVDRVQVWEPNAYDPTNPEVLADLSRRFDEVVESHKAAQAQIQEGNRGGTSYLPMLGAELRVVRMSDNPADGGKIIDLSGRMERTAATYEEGTNNVITPSTPITSEILQQNIQGYHDYIREAHGQDVRIELAIYTSYPTGRYNNDFEFKDVAWSPFRQMATARSRVAEDDEIYTEGGNYGGWGVINLSKDKTEDNGTVIPRHYVNRCYASSNSKGFIHRKIKSVDGQSYDLTDKLKGPILQYKTATSPHAPQANTNPSQGFQNNSAPAAPAYGGGYQSDEDIPFDALPTTRPAAPAQPAAPTPRNNPQDSGSWDDDIPFDDGMPSSSNRRPGM